MIRVVLTDAEAISEIDSSRSQVLIELLDTLEDGGIVLGLARLRSELRDEIAESRIEARIATDHIYMEVDDGVRAYQTMDV